MLRPFRITRAGDLWRTSTSELTTPYSHDSEKTLLGQHLAPTDWYQVIPKQSEAESFCPQLWMVYLRAEGSDLVVYANQVTKPECWVEVKRMSNLFRSLHLTRTFYAGDTGNGPWTRIYDYNYFVVPSGVGRIQTLTSEWPGGLCTGYRPSSGEVYSIPMQPQSDTYPHDPGYRGFNPTNQEVWETNQLKPWGQSFYGYVAEGWDQWGYDGLSSMHVFLRDMDLRIGHAPSWVGVGQIRGDIWLATDEFTGQNDIARMVPLDDGTASPRAEDAQSPLSEYSEVSIPGLSIRLSSYESDGRVARWEGNWSEDPYPPNMEFSYKSLLENLCGYTLKSLWGVYCQDGYGVWPSDFAAWGRAMTLNWNPETAIQMGLDSRQAALVSMLFDGVSEGDYTKAVADFDKGDPPASQYLTGPRSMSYTMGRDSWNWASGEYVPMFVTLI